MTKMTAPNGDEADIAFVQTRKSQSLYHAAFDDFHFPQADVNFEIHVPKATVRKLSLGSIVAVRGAFNTFQV